MKKESKVDHTVLERSGTPNTRKYHGMTSVLR